MVESNLYDELLKATDNTKDITFSRYGTITKIDNGLCSVKEEEQDITHQNVPILNNLSLKTGDKVVLGFVENSIYTPFVFGIISGTEKDYYTKLEVDEKIQGIITGEIELEEYMKKQEYVTDLMSQDESSNFLIAIDTVIQNITGRGDL